MPATLVWSCVHSHVDCIVLGVARVSLLCSLVYTIIMSCNILCELFCVDSVESHLLLVSSLHPTAVLNELD